MNLVIPIIAVIGAALAVSVVGPVENRMRANLVRAAVVCGWVGILGGAVGIYTDQLAGFGVLLGVAACAGLALLPGGMRLDPARDVTASLGAVIPLVLGVLGLTLQVETTGGNSGLFLLHAGHWGALSAALVCAIIASGLASSENWSQEAPRKTIGTSIGLAMAALPIGAWIIGRMRGGPEGWSWAVPVASEAGEVSWQIPASSVLPQGLWLEAVVEMSWMSPLLIIGAVIGLGTGLATLFEAGRRASALGWFVSAAVSLAGLVGLLTNRTKVALPDAAPYRETAADILSGTPRTQWLVEQGGFVSEGDLYVPLGGIAPEVLMLGAAVLIGALAGLFSLRNAWPAVAGEGSGRITMALYGRDYALRAVIFGWLAWLLVTLIHWNHFGAVGVGSPAEWSGVGFLAVATGMLFIGWNKRNGRVSGVVQGLTPGVIFALLIVGISIGVVFDAPFGLSVVF